MPPRAAQVPLCVFPVDAHLDWLWAPLGPNLAALGRLLEAFGTPLGHSKWLPSVSDLFSHALPALPARLPCLPAVLYLYLPTFLHTCLLAAATVLLPLLLLLHAAARFPHWPADDHRSIPAGL